MKFKSPIIFFVVLSTWFQTYGQDTLYILENGEDFSMLCYNRLNIQQNDSLDVICDFSYEKLKRSVSHGHRIYNSADTTPFNGVLVTDILGGSLWADYYLSILKYERGLWKREGRYPDIINFGYTKGDANLFSDTIISNELGLENPLNLIPQPKRFSGFCSGVEIRNKFEYSFYPSGDLKSKLIYNSDKAYSKTEYFESGEISRKFILEDLDSIRWQDIDSIFYKNGQLVSYKHRYVNIFTRESLDTTISFRENGDTLEYYTHVNGEIHGYIISNDVGYDGTIRIQHSYWNHGQMTDIINDDVLYINKRGKIIEKEEFFKELNELGNRTYPDIMMAIKIGDGPILSRYCSLVDNQRKSFKVLHKIYKKYKVE